MNALTEDVVFLRTSSESATMQQPCEDEAPPSYHDAITIDQLQSEIALHDEHFYGDQLASASSLPTTQSREPIPSLHGELPPAAKWFVKASTDPSTWKLLRAGPLMTNATTAENSDPQHKRRYRVLFPPGYEDVYLHKTTWAGAGDAASLPSYHIELFSPKTSPERYEPEPIVLLGPTCSNPVTSNQRVRAHLLAHFPKVFAMVESEVSKTMRLVTFCESEFFSWDWDCKTAAARHDMRMMVHRGRRKVILTARLVRRLELIVDTAGKKGDALSEKSMKLLRRSVRESGYRLGRLVV